MQNKPNQGRRGNLPTDRSFLTFLLLNFITCGIYGIVVYTQMSEEINIVASKYDGRRTMNYCLLVFIVAPLTLGIGGLVWSHNMCSRMGDELRRRNIPYSFGAADFWLWCVLGSFLCFIGPWIFTYKHLQAMNMLNANYNVNG
ncbi:MAG: DUF4234 domain-containing protein [Clostridia bacterium]|nr:DUF4234 domain-containing protein [Clostridia bacterium]